jgi:hypothetical protein
MRDLAEAVILADDLRRVGENPRPGRPEKHDIEPQINADERG